MHCDYALIGGGLQNGLLALALRRARPEARLMLIDRDLRLGGNHTWSFHVDDIPPALAAAVAPLVVHRWDGYDVCFPDFEQGLDHPYAAVTSERLDAVVRERLGAAVMRAEVVESRPGRVTLRGGGQVRAVVVVDSRGPEARATPARTGWQKFFGLELRFAAPVLPAQPLLMDARVEQLDGYRFVYTLPFAADHGLVEDTYFSDTPALDVTAIEGRIRHYCAARGWPIAEVLRREQGALPLPWAFDAGIGPIEVEDGATLLRGGYQGGWFHPVTGYSFPVAARLAAFVAARAPERISEGFAAFAAAHRRQVRFAHLLSWMLFQCFPPEMRWNVLSRFYRLPEDTIRRFYALDLTLRDAARIVLGRPPRGFALRPAGRLEVARS